MAQPIIEVHNLGKKYRLQNSASIHGLRDSVFALFDLKRLNKPSTGAEFWALQDISFTVGQGEAIGIIGRNGAGKSTLLKILSQITPPTRGTITMKGRVASLLEVGTGFHLELTGRENIYLNGAILGMTRQEIRKNFDAIVTFAEIERFLDTPVKHYSSGMYVRLAFAVAAHLESEILIIDEVLAVGDRQFQKKCLGKMEEVGRQGRTIFFVSHNMAVIHELCQKCVLLDKGKLIDFGKTDTMISRYLARDEGTEDADIDLSPAHYHQNSTAGNSFRFTHLRITNSQHKRTTSINLQEPFTLEIEGRFTNHTGPFSVGLSVNSSLGFPVFNTSITEKDISITPNGTATFCVTFNPNIFGPGMYAFGLSASGSSVIDWVPDVMTIHIEQFSLTSDITLPSNFEGIVLYPCQWSVVTN